MDDDDCIYISDDDEVEVIGDFITCEPIIIDLTETKSQQQQQQQQQYHQQHQQQQQHQQHQQHQQQEPQFQTQPQLQPQSRPQPQSEPTQSQPQPQPQPQPQSQPRPKLQPQKQPSPPPTPSNPILQPRPPPPLQQQYQQRHEPQQQQQQPREYTHQHKQPTKQPSAREQLLAKKELGNKLYRNNQLNEAIRQYRDASDLAKSLDDKELLAILHFNLAMSYSRIGSYNQAIDECTTAIKIDNNYLKAHCKRAEIFMSQGKYDEAVICYEYICELDSTKKEDAMKRIHFAREMSKRKRKLDQFEILGLSSNCSIEELRKAYRMKARSHHPDRHSDSDIVTRRIHEKIFKEASEAYAFFQKRYGFH